jgi:amino acid adenylation domain-containing protein/non-ribosomal peptide synthase protein (TIGR01720 family)
MSDLPSIQAPRPAETARKRLLQKLLRGQGLVADGIPRADRSAPLPLSFAQQRLWFLDRLDPGSNLYNIPLMLELEGDLDAQAIHDSLLRLVERHDALRTTIDAGSGEPAQRVHDDARLPWALHDLRGRPDAAHAARALAEEIALSPFDLEAGPLLRTALVRYGDRHAILVLSLHHIVADGWSLGVLMREFAMHYGERTGGIPAVPPAQVPLQYPDYAAWQRQRLDETAIAPLLAYWTQHLSPLPDPLAMPSDPVSAGALEHAGGRVALALDGPRLQALRDLAHRERCTLFVALLAAWAVALHRFSGQTDLVIGAPVAGRDRADMSGCVGLFVNTLALRCAVDGDASFAQLLNALRQSTQDGLAHAELPFERLVQTLAPDRSGGQSPLFQVAFDYINTDLQDISLPGLKLRPLDLENPPAKFDLTLVIGEYPGGVSAGIEYDAGRFGAARMQTLARAFERLVDGLVAHPDAPLGDAPLMSPAERRKVLLEWNADRATPAIDRTLVSLLAAQAAKTPDAPAIETADLRLTHAELDQRANRLAHRLQALGAAPETMVGVCLPRSAEAIVAFLAVMKAGAAYVPLDPTFPAGRLAMMCEDARPTLVLTLDALRDVLPPLDVAVVCLDDTTALDGMPDTAPAAVLRPDHAAYVVYTSGSTGRPKGVVATHRGCVRLVQSPDYAALGPDSRVLQFSTITFDAATFEIWAALAAGGCVVVAPQGNLAPSELLAFVRERRVDTMFLTTALFNHVADMAPALFEHVGQVLFGGEAVSAAHVARALQHARPGGLVHVYGPTETTTFATFHPLHGSEGGIPIGRPIVDTRCYVLDARLQPVPPGVPGELYIGGAGLARGYLNRPGLTAERFVPDPFDVPGARMYRSGDVVSQREDGSIEFVGRVDHQVKIRGFRIELGEIEAALRALPEVADVRVLCREDTPGDRRLAAYVVPRDPQTTGATLREALRDELPEFMVPTLWATLPALPLTPTGKIDWRALPAIEGAAAGEGDHEAPRDDTERLLADIWREVLGVERVGIRDNFFDIGGHSLAAMQVATRVTQVFAIDLPLRTLFDALSLADLALAIGRLRAVGAPVDVASIRPAPEREHHPLSHAQKRLWFLAQMEPDNPFYNIPWAIELEGRLDLPTFERALAASVQRHDALRTVFVHHDGQAHQRVLAALDVPVRTVDLSGFSPEEARAHGEALAAAEARTGFDLENGPLLRCTVAHLPGDRDLMLLTVHHIVADGWSMGVMMDEMSRVYVAGNAEVLGPPTLRYIDYTQWQNELLAGEPHRVQQDYWLTQLGGTLPQLDLPSRRARPAVQSYRGRTLRRRFDAAETTALHQLARRHQATLFITLMAAFKSLLCRLTGETDLIVGTPIAGRRDPALEKLVGFFVNTLALRTSLDGDPTFGDVLGRVRDTALTAWAHQDYPFDQLVEKLNPPRDLGRQPIFTVLLTVQNEIEALARDARFAGMAAKAWTHVTNFAKFDLSVFVTEDRDGLSVHLEYATDLFDEDEIDALFAQLRHVVSAVAADAQLRLSEVPLLSTEQSAAMVALSPARTWPAITGTLHGDFETIAERHADRIAVWDERGEWTYAELRDRSRRIANALRARGVGPEVPVALCMERSADLVAAVLGVLQAGGVYVPLDPAYPDDRLVYSVEDARPLVVLADGEQTQRLQPLVGTPVLALDDLLADAAADAAWTPVAGMDPAQAAYVIYTSGSTGKPKGVVVTHGNVLRLMQVTREGFDFGPDDAWTLFHSYAFDFSVWEIWGALLYGGKLVVVPYMVSRSPQAFRRLLIDQRVTVLNQTPSAFQQLVAADAEETDDALHGVLRYVVFGGEALNVGALAPWWNRHGRTRPQLINMYGITETTVHVTYEALGGEQASLGSIGRALGDLRVYVLDDALQPVPMGVAGELCVSGAGLARGYLGKPGLTASRFVPDPHGDVPGARMYRSGDLARWKPDGSLEYLGRMDHQVKVRGFRIELGEIEAALLTHEQVREAAVVVQPDETGGRLVAYVASAQETVRDDAPSEADTQLEQWQAVFEHAYGQESDAAEAAEAQDAAADDDGDFNIVGWTRRVDGTPIPAEEMRQWLEGTVRRLQAIGAGRVLELGSGTGMLLLRLAPGCERYIGLDFSQESLRYVGTQLRRRGLNDVRLLQRAAHQIDDLEQDYELVVLNSVAQYFPSPAYFRDVVKAALRRLQPGGRLFLGDLRNLAVEPAFAAGLSLQRAGAGSTAVELRHAAQSEEALDAELLLDPAAIVWQVRRWAQDIGLAVDLVQVLPREGEAHNELSGYRYDVVVQKAASDAADAVAEAAPLAWASWQDGWTVDRLRDALQALAQDDAPQAVLALEGVPNARVSADAHVAEWLQELTGWRTAGELRARLAQLDPHAVIDPHALQMLAEDCGLAFEMSWAQGAADGRLRVLFAKPGAIDAAKRHALHAPAPEGRERPWSSQPQQAQRRRELPQTLREHLQKELPSHMVPSAYVWVPKLPLTGNGKLDRKALPPVPAYRVEQTVAYEAPQDEAQQRMAGIWAEVLGLARVGAKDNFFELGGHSLLATQVASRVQKAFGVEMPLRLLFEHPTVAGLCERLQTLQATQGRAEAVARLPERTHYALSHAQQRMWLLAQLDPESSEYHMVVTLALEGALRVDVLQASLDALLQRHEALRTVFETVDGEPMQRILPAGAWPIAHDDLSGFDAAARDDALLAAARAEAQRPFDLATDLPCRGRLLRLDDGHAMLVLVLHHIVSDGWSMDLLSAELAQVYRALAEGRDPALPAPVVRYIDVAAWQNARLHDGMREQQRYWLQALAELPPPLDLPADRARPARRSGRGATVTRRVGDAQAEALRALAKAHDATLYATLLAAFQVLLSRLSGSNDIVLGTPIANRHHLDVEGVVGFFVNTLVLRARPQPAQRFDAWLRQVQADVLRAIAHQDYPFDQLVEQLQPERDLSRTPLFQVMFAVRNQGVEPPVVDLGDVRARGVPLLDNEQARFDLSATVRDGGGAMHVEFEYSLDLFDAATIEAWLDLYLRVLDQAGAAPQRALAELVAPVDLAAWRASGEGPAAEPLAQRTLDAAWVAQAWRTPQAPALSDGTVTLTYADALHRSSAIAHGLRASGVTCGQFVAVAGARSIDTVLAYLGVLQSGASFVYLDPALPLARMQQMLQDTAAMQVLLTGAATLPDDAPPARPLAEVEAAGAAQTASGDAPTHALAEGVAHVIYTSGSTGRPKGVLVGHRNVLRLAAQSRELEVQPQHRVLQAATLSFDASTFEIWNALLRGAEVVVATDDAVGDPERLAAFIAEQRIDVAWLTSSLFNAIVDLDATRLSGLSRLLAGGEALSVAHIARALDVLGPGRLVNGYGPTENTTFSTTHLIDAIAQGQSSVPIGRPLQDSSARVLDAFGAPVPPGVPGELYVGGDGVAFGYLGQPAMTAERFLPDPWSARPGARLYRTGDRVRQRADGTIEYLGRNDTQLKIRGFRIEPGEIEAALAAHPLVGAAAVIAPRGPDGMPRLVAYVSAPDGARDGLSPLLRAHLRERLPEYMVPAQIVVLDALPLTRNGKLDVAALPAPADEAAGADARPSTPLQQIVAAVWSDVLGVAIGTLGLHDDFFERGGHSLLAAQVVSRLRAELAVELPLRTLFEAPTIAELAAAIEPALAQGDTAIVAPPVVALHRDGPAPLSLFQQRFWFLDRAGQPYRASLALQLNGDLDIAAFEHALAEVVRRHEVLRSRFPDDDGRPMQHVLPLDEALPLPLALTDLSTLPQTDAEAALQRLVTEEARRPIDLARGPVLRAALVRSAADRHTLLLTLHHIVYDAWSLGILMRELDAGYRAARQGQPSPLAPLPVQYADFAAWQHQRLQGESLQGLLAWWRDKLHDVPQALNLPTDRPRPATLAQEGHTLECPLPDALSDGLQALARRTGSTLFMTMLAAFDALLHRVCRQDDLCVGTLAADRSRIEVEPLIGMFVNVLALRSRFTPGQSFESLLRQTRREVLEAFAHQDLPFETLLEQPFVQRVSGQSPLFQAMFVLENEGLLGLGETESDGLDFIPAAGDVHHARCDLTLNVRERDGRLCSYFEYDTRLFDQSSIERLMAQWLTLLEGIVATPQAAIDALPLPGEAELALLRAFSPAYAVEPVTGTLHGRFGQAAQAHPQAVAVWDQGRTLTYAELDAQSDHLARLLRTHGVGPEVPVALCLERSLDMVAAVLGVLKAGGAYVPLDPAYPAERLAYTVEDARPAVVIAHAALRERMQALTDVPVLDLEALLAQPAPADAPALPVDMPSAHAAYVIYTSGSTGKPKGVTVTHANVLRLFDATRSGFDFDHRDVWTLFHSYAFDFSVWEIWGPLLFGGRLVVVPYLLSRSPEAFRRLLIEQRVTVLNQTPSAFQQLVAADAQAHDGVDALALRYVVFGGEALNVGSLAPWFRRHGHRKPLLVNMYGITETTVHVTYEALHEEGASLGTIGRAIDDLRCYVLDAHQRPLPIGVPGELCVAGAGLARGYLRRPGLTAERFVPDPFATQPGQRMYRSGDLARWRPDGSLEYLGRIDQQVKVRGFRIELGEIEAALLEHAQVHEAAVVVQPDASGGRLVAYVASPDEAPAQDAAPDLQQQLQQWRSVFEHTYADEDAPATDAPDIEDAGDFNIVGWTCRLDGSPIPADEMREWVEGTVARLRALRPRRVLELGSGTGMLLLRLAPDCEHYLGTDFSPTSLAYVRRQLDARGDALPGVELLQRAAHEIDDLAQDFDLVILNSVAQYFPSADYFRHVVAVALRRLAPGGTLFLGDLRSLPLLPAFAAGLALQRATPAMPASALRHAAHSEAAHDGELLLDPAALTRQAHAWAGELGLELAAVCALPRDGRAHNELSGYRFDLVLTRAGGDTAATATLAWHDWQAEGWTPARLRERLQALAAGEGVLALRDVPNARTAADALTAQWLRQPPSAAWRTAAELRPLLDAALPAVVDPHDLRTLADEFGLQFEMSWIDGAADGRFRAVFAVAGQPMASLRFALHALPDDAPAQPWASHPQQALLRRRLPVLLREHLQQHLPEHMVPSAYVWMPRLPLTGNGKLDRQALPPPPTERIELADRYEAPQTETQQRMAAIWAEVLGVSRVGIHDNFFELGGHSLLATQVAARAHKAFGVDVPLRALFEQPTIAALCQHLETLHGADTDAPPPMRPVPRDGDELPMSFAQQRLWFLDRLDPGSSVYNIPLAMHVRGHLDVDALQCTLDAIVRRHEVLRTCFGERDDQPVQRVLPAAPAELRVMTLPPEQARAAAEAFAQEPFDLSRGPLLRTLLVRTGDAEALLAFSMHHIVGDGWSIGVLVKEMAALYPGFLAGHETSLPPLPVQYADFAVWQRRWLEGPELQRQLGYWREALHAPLPVLDLPTDFARPPRPSHRGGHVPIAFGADTIAALRALAQREGCTPYMVLFAAFSVLLSRHAGQDDLVIGTPVANRRQAEVEPLVGFFVNTLPVRIDLSGRPSFRELLGRAREVSFGAQAHQDLPFERLVEELQPVRDPGRSPLFQAGFDYINTAQQALELPGITLSAVETEHTTSKFDLSLLIGEHADGLFSELEYSADLFRRDTVERMGQRFVRLLDAALHAPETAIDALPLSSDDEIALTLREWNDAADAQPVPNVVERFEAIAARDPAHPALRFGSDVIDYGTLNARANRLAHALVALGVGTDDRVALCLERGLDVPTSMLAVLKAGAAYLPLDPGYPAERIAYMLDDARPRVVLARRAQAALVAQVPDGTVVLWLDDASIGTHADANPQRHGAPQDLAYVIYTSGSTGKPKGTLLTHAGLANLSQAQQRLFGITSQDRVLQFASINFDASTWETAMALASGATLCLATTDELRPGAPLTRTLRDHGVTVATLPPVAVNLLSPDDLPTLRTLVVAGEACPPGMAQRWSQGGRAFFNAYGPTETTVCASAYRCRGDESVSPPIGRAIAGMRLYVVDAALRPQPLGVPGELCVAGIGLARGYAGRAGLTADRFVPEPFSGTAGARMYRTGDLVRWTADGQMEFLGRIDHQVKIRGARVELGEVEAALHAQPGVREALVLAHGRTADERSLIGYVVADADGVAPQPNDLRQALRASLPEFMVPAQVIVLEAWPLTANGKIDRARLPVPGDVDAGASFVAPRDEPERLLAAIWQQVLRREQVGVDDNFFDLGGHSLAAMHMAARVTQAFGVELQLREVFEAPTLAALARAIGNARGDAVRFDAGSLPRVPDGEERPLSHAQRRLWFLTRMEPGNPFYNLPAAMLLDGRIDADTLRAALQTLLDRHAALRTVFREVDGHPRQRVLPQATADLPVVDLTSLPVDQALVQARELARREAEAPFDLARGPLLRGLVAQLPDGRDALMITMHHIVADGWSMNALVEELGALLAGKALSTAVPLKYIEVAQWQNALLEGEALQRQRDYWCTQLGGELTPLELPADRARPPVLSYRGDTRGRRLPPALATALRQLARAHNATLFMALLAAYKALLARLGGQSDIVVGTPIAGRRDPALEAVVGFFVNTLVLRTQVDGASGFADLLGRVRETALGAWSHADYPFDMLVEDLNPPRQMGRHPVFNVFFTLQNEMKRAADGSGFAGYATQALSEAPPFAKFDLSMFVSEVDDTLLVQLEYSTDLFDASRIDRMLAQFERLLEAAVADPARSLDRVGLLGADEYRQWVGEFNARADREPPVGGVHRLFEAMVARDPERVAVVDGDVVVARGDLDARAERLAAQLRSRGVRRETCVALLMDRSIAAVVAMLAVLKAGATYVPLDPDYPAARLELILGDTAAPCLLTVHAHAAQAYALAEQVPSLRQVLELHADGRCAETVEASAFAHGHDALPCQAAYVMYTSGSTGTPKGVVVTHRGIARLVHDPRFVELGEADTVLQLAPLGFDASTLEIWGALCNGAQLVLAPGGTLSLEAIGEQLRTHRVSVLWLTAALFQQMVEHRVGDLAGVRELLAGGDALPLRQVRRFLEACPGNRLINGYGPTENTTFSTTHPLTMADVQASAVPIGRPIDGSSAYVLDDAGQPQPVGVPGQLYVGGAGLARGYLGRPGLTAERFVPHPYPRQPGERLYATGDIVRLREDGTLEFIGRADGQVKVRGHRIELGEIEAVLARHPAVRETAVLARRSGEQGERQLVAYVAAEPPLSADAVREFLRASLPDYLVPTRVVSLDRLPMTRNGKVDRNALPAPDDAAPARDRPLAEARNDAERALVQAWQSALGKAEVGIDDNFFDLGGDSILSLQIVARLHDQGWHASPRLLFLHQSIAELAPHLERRGGADPAQPVSGDVALTPIQHWFFGHDFVVPGHWNHAVLLAHAGAFDADVLREALQALLEHHDALRLGYRAEGGRWAQYNAPPGAPVAFEVVDLSAHADAAVALAQGIERIQSAEDLDGPLMRVGLFRLPDGSERLLVVVHHLAIDAVSWPILLQDLAAAYAQLQSGAPVTLPSRTTSYQAWAARFVELAEAGHWDAEREHWRRTAIAAAQPKPFTATELDPATSGDAVEWHGTLSADATATLQDASRQQRGTQVQALLLTGLMRALRRWRGADALVVDIEGHGRETDLPGFEGLDLSRTVGWFTALYPVALALPANGDTGDDLAQVKTALRDVPNRGLGWGALRHLAADPVIASAPTPLLCFNHLGQQNNAATEGEAALGPAPEPVGTLMAAPNRRTHALTLTTRIEDGVLQLHLSYAQGRFDAGDIAGFGALLGEEVQRVAEHAADPDNARLDAADMDLLHLSQDELDNLFD